MMRSLQSFLAFRRHMTEGLAELPVHRRLPNAYLSKTITTCQIARSSATTYQWWDKAPVYVMVQQHQSGGRRWSKRQVFVKPSFVVGTGALALGLATGLEKDSNLAGGYDTTLCESPVLDSSDDEEDEEDEDPYDNLPEEDEPTHCSICLTYRQGPCRPYWRKVEACTKDNEMKKDSEASEESNETANEDDENRPDPPCLKYMLPWIECATGYRNLYALIELDTNYTSGIADLEKDATMEACWAPSSSAHPTVDWLPWKEYVAEHPEWKLPRKAKKRESSKSINTSLWKTLESGSDPELVEVLANVSVTSPDVEARGILECAYAVDQDGNVLGFAYGTKPSEVAENVEDKSPSDKNDTESAVEINGQSTIELKIRLLPKRTRSIRIKAAYTPVPKEGGDDHGLESHIYRSKSFSLKQMGKS